MKSPQLHSILMTNDILADTPHQSFTIPPYMGHYLRWFPVHMHNHLLVCSQLLFLAVLESNVEHLCRWLDECVLH
jgi:hypothetical protein